MQVSPLGAIFPVIYSPIDSLASHCCSSSGFCRIRCNYCCHTHRPGSSHLLWPGSSAGDQIVNYFYFYLPKPNF